MAISREPLKPDQDVGANMPSDAQDVIADFRHDLAFPTLTGEIIGRLKDYGREEIVPENVTLYTCGDLDTNMFVVLTGGIDVILRSSSGGYKVFARHRERQFSGEFSLLNSQREVTEARTVMQSHLLRISRKELKLLMRSEGEIANIIVSAAIWRRIGINGDRSSGVLIRGYAGSADLMHLQRFFVHHYYPYRIEVISTGKQRVEDMETLELPSVVMSDGRVLVRPSISHLADELGITELPDPHTVYDVAVVGAGPSGLAAAVNAASEGLSTIVIEGTAPGGQAGTSSKIENYLGFPTGVSGAQLASRGHLQALKFGVQFVISREIVRTQQTGGIHKLTLAGGKVICAQSIVIATGAQYRRLSIRNQGDFENRGLYYAATAMESLLCHEQEIIVVGGGNSAGQAAVYLSGVAKHVHHIIRGSSLKSTMSQYLISRIERSQCITLYTQTEIEKLEGNSTLEFVTWTDHKTGESTRKPIGIVFVMIGAEPNSGWLCGTVKLDQKGFVLTGPTYGFESTPYATSVPGIYAVGDVRSNSVKRIASAVGEGSVVISNLYRYLAEYRNSLRAH